MEPFLKRLADVLIQQHGRELDQIAVVLPGRRAGMVLRRYLADALQKPFWSPEVLDIGSFMERATGWRQAGGMELLFLLHDVHSEQRGVYADPLLELLRWGPTTLRDMSEVDTHLLDLDLLYRDLRNYQEIEEWSFKLDDLSTGQERLRNQWRTTGELHRTLLERMAALGVGTSGSLARKAAEMTTTASLNIPWKAVWFAGLNALEPAYLKVIRHLQERGLAHLAWDTDHHYLDDRRQEAGSYLRRSIAALGPGAIPPVHNIKTKDRDLDIITVPAPVAQAQYAAQFLATLSPAERSETLVVLADENLLPALLEALPPDIGPLNVTMGLPLRNLPVHGLVEKWLELQIAYQLDGDRTPITIPLPLVEGLLLHPFLHQGPSTLHAVKTLREAADPRPGLVAVLKAATGAGMDHLQLLGDLLHPMAGIKELELRLNVLLGLAQRIRSSAPFAREQLYRLARLHQRLHKELARVAPDLNELRTFSELRLRMLQEERMDLYGEPLQGLQVMGLLETRAIDHERVLVLGATEGHLPHAAERSSWIPFDIRKHYGLPLPADVASIGAYHFNRLAQGSRELYLVHAVNSGDGAAEPSRFIAQWEHEVVGQSATKATHHQFSAAYPVRRAPVIEVIKSPAVMERLDRLLDRGISPSAMATWLRCPLDLYFSYIMGLRAPNDVNGELGSDILGEAVHRAIEEVYSASLGKVLDPDHLRKEATNAEASLVRILREQFPAHTLAVGHFRLRIELASRAIASYLLAEADRCGKTSIVPLSIELEVLAELAPGIKIKGRCDRIELREGVHHILDLKTGKVDEKDMRMDALERALIKPNKRYALQLLMYAYAYMIQVPDVQQVRTGIIPLQKASLSNGIFLSVGGSEVIGREQLPAIARLLSEMVSEIRDPDIPLRHNVESTWCSCCTSH